MHSSSLSCAALLAALSLVAPACLAAPAYQLVDLGPNTSATSLNANANVLGERNGKVARYFGGQWHSVPSVIAGAALNDAGQVAGTLMDKQSSLATSAWWSKAAGAVEIAPLGTGESHAHAISGNGTVVGTGILDPVWGSIYAFKYQDGKLTRLSCLVPTSGCDARGVNDAGQITGATQVPFSGSHAFLYDPTVGFWRELGTLGGRSSIGMAINAAGHVVGNADVADGVNHHAFFFDGTTMIDLGAPDGGSSFATALNDHDAVVGGMVDAAGTPSAFFYKGGKMHDLASLVDNAAGWTFVQATAINAKGQIAGNGLLNGVPHAFLLDKRN